MSDWEDFQSPWFVGDNDEEYLFQEDTIYTTDDFPASPCSVVEQPLPDELNGNETEPNECDNQPNMSMSETSSFPGVDVGKVEQVQAKPETTRERTKYGTGIKAQRTRDPYGR